MRRPGRKSCSLPGAFINFALAAVVSTLKNWLHTAGAVTVAAMLASGAVMTFWLRKSRYERRWYSSRAVAESVKTLSWRYMMRAAPFEGGSPEADAEAATLFEKFDHDIADQEAAPAPEPHEITAKMREVRHRAAAERADMYMKERIEDQRTWYARNCEKNSRNGNRTLWFAIATQVIACGFALIQIAREIPDFVGVFATVSAGALAWMQLKKYEDLA
jgi:Flp pilus assembly protein TadB